VHADVGAIVDQIIMSLHADPDDRSGRIRGILNDLDPATRQTVVEQAEHQLAPAHRQQLRMILGQVDATPVQSAPVTDTETGEQLAGEPIVSANVPAGPLDANAAASPDLSIPNTIGEVPTTSNPPALATPADGVPVTAPPVAPEGPVPTAAGTPSSGNTTAVDNSVMARPAGPSPANDVPAIGPTVGGAASATAPPPSAMPNLAASAEQITAFAETEKATIRQTVESQRSAIQSEVAAKTQSIDAATQARIQTITAVIEGKQAEITQSVATTRAAIQTEVDTKKAAAQADGEKAIESIHREIADKRKAALQAAEGYATQTEQTGEAEAQRATTSSGEVINRVQGVSRQKGDSFNGDQGKRGTVIKALAGAASDIASKIQGNGQSNAQAARETSKKAAQEFRRSGESLAADIDSSPAQVEESIRQVVAATVKQVQLIGTKQLQGLETAESQARSALEKLQAEAIVGIQQAGQAAQAAVTQSGDLALSQLDGTEEILLQQFDQLVSESLQELASADGSASPDADAIQQGVQQLGVAFQQARVESEAVISDQSNDSIGQLADLESTFTDETDSIENNVNAAADQTIASLNNGLSQAQTASTNQMQQAIDKSREAMQQPVDQFSAGLEQKIDEAKQHWTTQHTAVQNELKASVDKGIQKDAEAEQKAPAHFDSVVNNVGSDSFKFDWWGALKAVGEFIVGAIIVTAAVGLIVAVFAVSLPVAIAFVLVVGVVMSLGARCKEAAAELPENASWLDITLAGIGALSAAILDVLGIAGIYEGITDKSILTGKKLNQTDEQRTERAVLGALVILGFIIGAIRGAKGGKVPVEEDPNVDPNKATDPNADPNADPNKGGENKGTAPVKPPTTLTELRTRLSPEAQKGFDQQQELLSEKEFNQATDSLKNPDGSYDVAKANERFTRKALPDDEFQKKREAKNAREQARAQKAVEKIKNTCDETDGTNRPDAQIGDGSSEAALDSETNNGKPVGGRGHAKKCADAIRSLNDALSDLSSSKDSVTDPVKQTEIQQAETRAKGRIDKMRPAVDRWNSRVADHPEVWNPDGTSKVTPGFPKDPGPI
jgi:hypothetical protein